MSRGPRPASRKLGARAPWRKVHLIPLTCFAAFFLAGPHPAAADGVDDNGPVIRNNFGSVGLIDMPSARMAPDGEIGVGASFLRHNQHYNLTFQALPWLETDFRYSGLEDFNPDYPVYYDRSFALKARLWDETDIFPAVAIGINDLVGTGVYSGEYLVASKQFGPFDATLGIGWGRLGTTALFNNPLSDLSSSFATRTSGLLSPGSTNFSSFFHGPDVGLFGGVVWHTPIDKLSLVLEYSSDTYQSEDVVGAFRPRGQVNVGASYQVFDNISLGMSWLYGTTLNGNITFALDPTRSAYTQHINDAALPALHLRSDAEQLQALNALVLQRPSPANAGALLFSSSGLNALSDALFAETGDLNDVSTRGRTLVLNVSKGDVQSVCARTAAIVARYDVEVETVSASNATGRAARCTVQRRGGGAVVNAVLLKNPDATILSGLSLAPASVLTIDASAPASVNPQTAIQAVKTDAAQQKIIIQAVSFTGSEAIIYFSNMHYYHEDDAVDRLVRVLMADAPPDIEKFRLLSTLGGVVVAEFTVLRGPTERNIAQTGRYSLLDNGNGLADAPLQNPVLSASERGTYPRLSWDYFPQFRQELFDPQNPFAVQFLAGVQGAAELRPGLTAFGEAEASIYDNFNTKRESDSVLPHVRTDWTKFFTEGKNGIGQLELDYLTRLAPDVFAQARVGYLESMFAGVGGEILWRPEGQRLAIGGDLYEVQERAFNRLFGLQTYRAVTGHVTLYYASPWYGVNFAIRAGQYLAGDHGVTIEMTRRFSTGVELGAFFTKTNVSAQRFGEGSFDKGFIIRIPLGWTMPISTQSVFSTIIRPVQRDGGQTLDNDATLYRYLQRSGTADIFAHSEKNADDE